MQKSTHLLHFRGKSGAETWRTGRSFCFDDKSWDVLGLNWTTTDLGFSCSAWTLEHESRQKWNYNFSSKKLLNHLFVVSLRSEKHWIINNKQTYNSKVHRALKTNTDSASGLRWWDQTWSRVTFLHQNFIRSLSLQLSPPLLEFLRKDVRLSKCSPKLCKCLLLRPSLTASAGSWSSHLFIVGFLFELLQNSSSVFFLKVCI